jgi:hypothetical protein
MKQKLSPWMVMCLFVVSIVPAWGLDINEELTNIKILTVYSQNTVVLNRGAEDGVAVGTHAKLRSSEGFAARGLCVKVGMLTSHWRLYRIVDSELVSKDFTYTLIGLDSSEAPRQVETWQRLDHDKVLPDFDEKKLLPPEKAPPEKKLKADLPESLEKDPGFDENKSATRLLIEKNYDPEKLRRDFQKVKVSLFASPWSVQRGGNTEIQNVRYGGMLANEGSKYKMAVGYDHSRTKARETRTTEEVVNEFAELQGTFTVKEITTNWDAYSDVTYREASFGEISTPKSHFLIAPIGFTRHFGEGTRLKKSFLSYAPTYDTRTHEAFTDNGSVTERKESGLRHAFRLFMQFEFGPDFTLTSDLRWRPIQDFSSWGIDMSDNLMQERLVASWRLVSKLHLDYEFLWLDDAQLRRLNDLPRVVTTNSLNVRYDFDF